MLFCPWSLCEEIYIRNKPESDIYKNKRKTKNGSRTKETAQRAKTSPEARAGRHTVHIYAIPTPSIKKTIDLGSLGLDLDACWDHLGSTWALTEVTWARLERFLGSLGLKLGFQCPS